jgi:3'-phosphoadenosine 5'-phosphosulfate sulfotransferase
MKERMARSGYPHWDICVDEHVVRAINIRLNAMGISEAEAQRLLESDLRAGFTYVTHLTERLKEYEDNRDAYPTLGHFFPRIVELFAEMSPGS